MAKIKSDLNHSTTHNLKTWYGMSLRLIFEGIFIGLLVGLLVVFLPRQLQISYQCSFLGCLL